MFIVLFADDIILLSATEVAVQAQLSSLSLATSKLKLQVNMNKSSIRGFRKGGYLA